MASGQYIQTEDVVRRLCLMLQLALSSEDELAPWHTAICFVVELLNISVLLRFMIVNFRWTCWSLDFLRYSLPCAPSRIDASGGDFAEVGGNLPFSTKFFFFFFFWRKICGLVVVVYYHTRLQIGTAAWVCFFFFFLCVCVCVVANSEVFFNQKRTKGSSRISRELIFCTASFHIMHAQFHYINTPFKLELVTDRVHTSIA